MNKEQIEQAAANSARLHFHPEYSKDAFTACVCCFKSGATWQQSQSVEQPVNADILGAAKLTIAMINGMSPQVQQEGNMPLMMLMAKYIVSLANYTPEIKWVGVEVLQGVFDKYLVKSHEVIDGALRKEMIDITSFKNAFRELGCDVTRKEIF